MAKYHIWNEWSAKGTRTEEQVSWRQFGVAALTEGQRSSNNGRLKDECRKFRRDDEP